MTTEATWHTARTLTSGLVPTHNPTIWGPGLMKEPPHTYQPPQSPPEGPFQVLLTPPTAPKLSDIQLDTPVTTQAHWSPCCVPNTVLSLRQSAIIRLQTSGPLEPREHWNLYTLGGLHGSFPLLLFIIFHSGRHTPSPVPGRKFPAPPGPAPQTAKTECLFSFSPRT